MWPANKTWFASLAVRFDRAMEDWFDQTLMSFAHTHFKKGGARICPGAPVAEKQLLLAAANILKCERIFVASLPF